MIQIAARLKPFCHQPGTCCVIPLTTVRVEVFPTLIRFLDLMTGRSWEEKLEWKGPVEDFTVQLDLEKCAVAIFGRTAEGFRRLWIEAISPGIQMTWDQEKKHKEFAVLTMKKPGIERLSLGKHTKLDWSRVVQRMEVEEMVPVLFLLGQCVPQAQAVSPILDLLHFSDKQKVVKQLSYFFRAGFQGILSPRLQDEEFQGLVEEGRVEGSPLALLRRGYEAVRALIFQEEERGFALLPNLPPEFHAGRLIHLRSSLGDTISLEWSKKILRRVVIKPQVSREIFLDLQKSLCSYRVNRKKKHEVKKPLLLEAGQAVFLDRFEK